MLSAAKHLYSNGNFCAPRLTAGRHRCYNGSEGTGADGGEGMERLRRGIRRACTLPASWTLLVAACGFGLLIWALSHGAPPVVTQLSLYLSMYALAVTVTGVMRLVPAVRQRVAELEWLQRLKDSPLGTLFLRDEGFRTWVAVFVTMTWNVACALLKLLAGVLLRSPWLRTLGIYDLGLAWLRLTLVLPMKPDTARAWRRYRACGAGLLAMNGVLVAMVIQILAQKGRFHYPGPLIYLMAVFAFWALTSAAIKLAKSHRRDDPLMSAARAVTLTAALTAMLALQTAMIARFGANDGISRLMTALTGGGICLIELNIAVYMLRRSSRALSDGETAALEAATEQTENGSESHGD